jgi:hypothetical protein
VGLRMSEKMIFCLGEGKYESKGIGYQQNYMIFNKKVSEDTYNQTKEYLDAKNFKLPVAKWVEYKNLSKYEQTSTAKQLDGLLKTLNYQDAWKEMWTEMKQEDKDFFKTIPNFDADIFEKITGIKYEEEIEELTLAEVCKRLGKNVKIIKN